jgi:hypothetical protein
VFISHGLVASGEAQMKSAAKWIKFIAGLVAFVALKAVYIVMEWAPLVLVILAICALGKYLIG